MGKKKEMATKKSGAQKDKKRIPNANLRHVEQVCWKGLYYGAE